MVADPLHGYCSSGCIDNGTNSPSTKNPPNNFGFTVSPGPASGSQFLIDVLVPNSENNPAAGPFTITGSLSSGTNGVTQLSSTAWTTGTLSDYLNGLGAANPVPPTGISETNPIGNFLPSTQAVIGTGATGFFVYQANLGAVTDLNPPGIPNVFPLLTISPGLPQASYIVAFLNEGPPGAAGGWQGTSNSGAIFVNRKIPEPGSLLLLGTALARLGGVGWYRRRRQTS